MRKRKLYRLILQAYRRGYEKGIAYGQNNKIPNKPTEFVVTPTFFESHVRQRRCFLKILQCTSSINIDNRIFFECDKLYYCESICYKDGYVVYWNRLNVVFDEVDLLNYFRPLRFSNFRNVHPHNSNR